MPVSAAWRRAAQIAALALRVSKMVSISSTSTPPSRSAAICWRYASARSRNVITRKPGSSTLGESESVTLVGPIAPATQWRRPSRRGRLVGGAAGEPGGGGVDLVDQLRIVEAVLALGHDRGREGVGRDDVGAGGEVAAVQVEHGVGQGEREHVVVRRTATGDGRRIARRARPPPTGATSAARCRWRRRARGSPLGDDWRRCTAMDSAAGTPCALMTRPDRRRRGARRRPTPARRG